MINKHQLKRHAVSMLIIKIEASYWFIENNSGHLQYKSII